MACKAIEECYRWKCMSTLMKSIIIYLIVLAINSALFDNNEQQTKSDLYDAAYAALDSDDMNTFSSSVLEMYSTSE